MPDSAPLVRPNRHSRPPMRPVSVPALGKGLRRCRQRLPATLAIIALPRHCGHNLPAAENSRSDSVATGACSSYASCHAVSAACGLNRLAFTSTVSLFTLSLLTNGNRFRQACDFVPRFSIARRYLSPCCSILPCLPHLPSVGSRF